MSPLYSGKRLCRLPGLVRSLFASQVLLLKCHFAACEQFDHALIEGRQVFRAAATDPRAITNHFLVYPVGTGIADVILDGVVAGHGLALDQAR